MNQNEQPRCVGLCVYIKTRGLLLVVLLGFVCWGFFFNNKLRYFCGLNFTKHDEIG